MRNTKFVLCLMIMFICGFPVAPPVFATESLVDAARRESERRDRIERLGIEEKVIEGNGKCSLPEGNVSVLKPSEIKPGKTEQTSFPAKDRNALRRYRKKLQNLDKNIRKAEARLEKLRERVDSLKKKNLGIGDLKGFRRNNESRDRILEQIEALQVDLKLLSRERRGVFDSGRIDGFLPGELEGKGIIP